MTSTSGSGLNEKNIGSWLLILGANKSITGLNLKCFSILIKTELFNFHSTLVSASLDSLHSPTPLQLLSLMILLSHHLKIFPLWAKTSSQMLILLAKSFHQQTL